MVTNIPERPSASILRSRQNTSNHIIQGFIKQTTKVYMFTLVSRTVNETTKKSIFNNIPSWMFFLNKHRGLADEGWDFFSLLDIRGHGSKSLVTDGSIHISYFLWVRTQIESELSSLKIFHRVTTTTTTTITTTTTTTNTTTTTTTTITTNTNINITYTFRILLLLLIFSTVTTIHAGPWPPSGSVSRHLYAYLLFASLLTPTFFI